MSCLKRKTVQAAIEISDDENDSPPVKKIRNTSPIDLTATDDEDTGDEAEEPTPSRVAKVEPAVSSPAADIEDQAAIQPSTPIPAAHSVESTSKNSSIPEAADRYVPRINFEENTEYRSPFKFCLKPPFWKKWSGSDYLNFVEELRSQFDPHPFSRRTGKPVEEILHVWSALVANPLYDTNEAKRRGEEGMQQQFEALNKFGTPNRPWAGGKVCGELDNIRSGRVLLITQAEGNKEELKFDDLSKADVNYLKASLTKDDWDILAGTTEIE